MSKIFIFDFDLTLTNKHTYSWPDHGKEASMNPNYAQQFMKQGLANLFRTIADAGDAILVNTHSEDPKIVKKLYTSGFGA